MTHPIEPIIKRVLEGEGEDRQLERDVAKALGWKHIKDFWHSPLGLYARVPPAYLTDLNAINDLRERELPGLRYRVDGPDIYGGFDARIEANPLSTHKERARAEFAAVLMGIVRRGQKDAV